MASHADEIRDYASKYVLEARSQGLPTVSILAGQVVRELRLVNRTPAVCSALASKEFQKTNRIWLEKTEGPPSGMSTTTRFVYRIEPSDEKPNSASDLFAAMRGAGRATFDALGGGETFLSELRNDVKGL